MKQLIYKPGDFPDMCSKNINYIMQNHITKESKNKSPPENIVTESEFAISKNGQGQN